MLAPNQAGVDGQGDGGPASAKFSVTSPVLWNQALQEVPWLSAVPQDLFIFIGVCEFIGGVGQQARVERRTLQISFRSLTSPLS